jgi:hypothetical protein
MASRRDERSSLPLLDQHRNDCLKLLLGDLCFWEDPRCELRGEDRMVYAHKRQSCSDAGTSPLPTEPRRMDLQRTQSAEISPPPAAPHSWKPAIDPQSGRTYYYDAVSRKSQWEKVRTAL